MRISSVRDLALYVRDRRRARGWSQDNLAQAAGVSRRWLTDLEAGKPTAEIGLVIKTLDALELQLFTEPATDENQLDQLLQDLESDDE